MWGTLTLWVSVVLGVVTLMVEDTKARSVSIRAGHGSGQGLRGGEVRWKKVKCVASLFGARNAIRESRPLLSLLRWCLPIAQESCQTAMLYCHWLTSAWCASSYRPPYKWTQMTKSLVSWVGVVVHLLIWVHTLTLGAYMHMHVWSYLHQPPSCHAITSMISVKLGLHICVVFLQTY